jgi:hypothetical protein
MMVTFPRLIAFLAVLISLGVANVCADEPPKDAALAERLLGLEPKKDQAVRLETLQWLQQHAEEKQAGPVIEALAKSIRTDPDGPVRRRAVAVISSLANRWKKPCPLAVVEALYDPVDETRWEAVSWAGTFKSFARGSGERLLRGVKSESAELRSTSLLLLPTAAGNAPPAIEAMEKACSDKVFDVRHCARLALFRARNKLAEHLPYLIRLREDPASVLSPGVGDTEEGKKEQMLRNLYLIASSTSLIEWSEERADELAAGLLKLLGDESALMRRGAANLVFATAIKVEVPARRDGQPFTLPGTQQDALDPILPFLDPEEAAKVKKPQPKKPPQKSGVARSLEKLGVAERLRKLRDDPDRSVREAAGRALERLASLNEKKP